MELADVEAFLVLAEELHFNRTAERMFVSPARVTQRIQALEREIGGALFTRTSRRVSLTPLGEQLRRDLAPPYEALAAAVDAARSAARSPAGHLRIGFTATTAGTPLDRLVAAFEQAQPGCTVSLHEVPFFDPTSALRNAEVDVLVNWLVDEPDLTCGPAIAEYPRALAVAADHPLAGRPSVSAEVLGDYAVPRWTLATPLLKHVVPDTTPSGREVRRHPTAVRTFAEGLSLVARGQAVHPTFAPLAARIGNDIVLVPIDDLPPMKLGPLWCAAYENARILAFGAVAATSAQASERNSTSARSSA